MLSLEHKYLIFIEYEDINLILFVKNNCYSTIVSFGNKDLYLLYILRLQKYVLYNNHLYYRN